MAASSHNCPHVLPLCLLLLLGGCLGGALALIIDHTALTQDPAAIPVEYIRRAKQMFRIGYQHTSHGSQIRSGMESLDNVFGADFAFTTKDAWGSATTCDANTFYCDYWLNSPSDLGDGTNNFDAVTAAALNRSTNTRNVVMWSWCGGVSQSGTDINRYLTRMDALEQQFPQVKFIYLTGHLDGSGLTGTLNVHNSEIRDFCRSKNKILFDFADLEAYDPDAKQSYLPLGSNDGCDYNQGASNWARDWHDAHAQHPLSKAADLVGSDCAHSEGLNCVQKAIAFWSMMARLAGWPGPGSATTSTSFSTAAGTGPATATATATATAPARSSTAVPSAARSSSAGSPAGPSATSSSGRGTRPRSSSSSSSTAPDTDTRGATGTEHQRRPTGNSNLICDHNCVATDLADLPIEYLRKAKSVLRIGYQHTSHGSQIRSGMDALATEFGSDFAFTADNRAPCQNAFLCDDWVGSPADLGTGHNGFDSATATALAAANNDRNVVMWSWCGGVSDSTADVTGYLNAMSALEQRFPNVTFIYLTGHLDGTGEAGTLHRHNEQIRSFCRENKKVLFDFADIESYDPSGARSFLPLNADAGCTYSQGNWATQWVQANPQNALTRAAGRVSSCAHSEALNCVQKSVAFWWLMARLAGWAGPALAAPPLEAASSSGAPGAVSGASGAGPSDADASSVGSRQVGVAAIAGVLASLLAVAGALSVVVMCRRRRLQKSGALADTCPSADQTHSAACSYTGADRLSLSSAAAPRAPVPTARSASTCTAAPLPLAVMAAPSAPRDSSVSRHVDCVTPTRASASAKRAPPPPVPSPRNSTASRTQL